jgi:hypothetical protein
MSKNWACLRVLAADPVDRWERLCDRGIDTAQGNWILVLGNL